MDHIIYNRWVRILAHWFISFCWKSCMVSPSFERVTSIPALQYILFGEPSLGTYLLSERLFDIRIKLSFEDLVRGLGCHLPAGTGRDPKNLCQVLSIFS